VQKNICKKEFECNVKIFSIFFPTFLAHICLSPENESLHLAYLVISLASEASMTSTASITSVASITSAASFHQKSLLNLMFPSALTPK
jgi:hypothetical protein